MKTIIGNKPYDSVKTEDKQQIIKDAAKKTATLKELKHMRGVRRKVYANGHGKMVAQFYDTPVNYRNQNNTYEEIDNSLVDSGDFYETKTGPFKTRFRKDLRDGKIYEVKTKSCMVGLISHDAAARNCAAPVRCECGNREKSSIKLSDIKDKADLEYIVDSTRVKENIIIRDKSEKYEFEFEMPIEDLAVGVSEDGQMLELKARETGRPMFFIPSPFMEDANGVRSDSVYYEIMQENANLLKLKVVANERWINAEKRVFPVVIDPQIYVNDSLFGTYSAYDDGYEDSIFRYQSYILHGSMPDAGSDGLNLGYPSGNELRITCYYDEDGHEVHIDSKLSILKNKIPAKMMDGLISARLKLNVKECTMSGDLNEVYIDGEYRSFYHGNSFEDVEIEITDRLKSAENEVEIVLADQHMRGCFFPKNVVFYPPELQLEFRNHIEALEIAADPVNGYSYFPGDRFDTEGMILNALYYNGEKEPIPASDCEISPAGSLATYDKYVRLTYEGKEVSHAIEVYGKGFNDRRPRENCENVYKLQLVNKDTGNPTGGAETYYVKLELADGASGDGAGTPLNAENLNRHLIINADNIYGKLSADKINGVIGEENLPERLRKSYGKNLNSEGEAQ